MSTGAITSALRQKDSKQDITMLWCTARHVSQTKKKRKICQHNSDHFVESSVIKACSLVYYQ